MKTLSQRIFASRLYPRLPQSIFLAIFIFVLVSLLSGGGDAKDNFGSVMIWILWWPLIPLSFIFLGRVWCAFCPWGALSDWLQSHFCLDKPVPRWIKQYGIWIIFAGFMGITWYELAYGLTTSAMATALLLLFILALALLTSLLYERRVWCRYLCPLGGIFGNYSQTALVEFRGTPEKCSTCNRADCYNGSRYAPGCSLYEYPKKMDSNRLCNLCGDCVKSCRKSSPLLRVRIPGKELWEKTAGRLDEAVLASVLVGVILISGFGMLTFWQRQMEAFELATGIGKTGFTSITFLIFAGGALLISLALSHWSGRYTGERALENIKRFGYALIPLNLATHSAHNLFHFLGEGGSVGKVVRAIFSPLDANAAQDVQNHSAAAMGNALASSETIQILQFSLLALGFAASSYTAWKISQASPEGHGGRTSWSAFAPHLVEIVIFTLLSLTMFVLPMAMRH